MYNDFVHHSYVRSILLTNNLDASGHGRSNVYTETRSTDHASGKVLKPGHQLGDLFCCAHARSNHSALMSVELIAFGHV
jgi:hypothetical protein